MLTIKYQVGCRQCLNGDGIERLDFYKYGKEKDFMTKTEYEVMKIVEQNNMQQNICCMFCDSKDLEYYEIKVEDYLLYDFERIGKNCIDKGEVMLMINIEKNGHNIKLTPGGTLPIEENNLRKSLRKIVSVINASPYHRFSMKERGSTFICTTSDELLKDFKIESFRSTGIHSATILGEINLFAAANGISYEDIFTE